jgi:hypothetical protein
VQRQRQLGAEEPIEGDFRARVELGDVRTREVLELVRAAIIGPHLEAEALGLRAQEEILRQDAEVPGAALEPGNQDENDVGRTDGGGETCRV